MKALELATWPPALVMTLAPILGLFANIATQIVLGRLPLPIGHVRRQFLSFGVGFAAATSWLVRWLPTRTMDWWDTAGFVALHLWCYAMLGFIFFNIINLNLSSLRVRMLKEYLRVDPQPLPDHVLREKYHTRGMLDARLERLLAGGQIVLRDGRYHVRRKAVFYIGRFFAFLQGFLLRK